MFAILPAMADRPVPLCVDLDGTLLKSDSLWESIAALLKRRPDLFLLLPFWMLAGKAAFKRRVTRAAPLDAALLPYNQDVLAWLRAENTAGAALVLATAADVRLADAIAAHLDLFDRVIASDDGMNLAGRAKADALVEAFGERGFDYAGNEKRDLAVWAHARHAIVVHAPAGVERAARSVTEVERVFAAKTGSVAALVRAIRPHQWLKNLLLFVPVITAHRVAQEPVLASALIAFCAFCLVTSGVYLLNDILDLASDRPHPRKRHRPLAAGDLPLSVAMAASPLFFLAGLAVALLLPVAFLGTLLAYVAVTMAYSFALKRIALVDVFTLASLYTVRIVAGHAATGLPFSFWLLLLSGFVFLSLALLKRYAELTVALRQGTGLAGGRGYRPEDAPQIARLGTAAGYLSVLVFALYANSPDVSLLYRHPQVLWLIAPLLLFWVSRLWLLADRGEVLEDPIVFTLKDPASYVLGALTVAVMMGAT
jgi:4-hydroxybenzoate polyprenyltransferase